MANAYTIKETPEATDSITISDVTGAIFKATLGSLPGTSSDSQNLSAAFDNIIVSNKADRDLYAMALLESYPG